jgi:hypothetical protein
MTDQPETWPGVENVRVDLPGWWAKMACLILSGGVITTVYLDYVTW